MPGKPKFRKKRKTSPKKKIELSSVEKSIIETLSYRALFNYPMSFSQLQNYLLCKKEVDSEKLKKVLKDLLSKKKIREKKGFYFLPKTVPVNWEVRLENSQNLISKAEDISKILSKIPWVQMIGVTGSVAACNATNGDDIDVFIVSKKNRLWLTRGFVTLILMLIGEYRTDRDPKKKICPNIFVDEKNLLWNKDERNVYVAHEVVLLHPVFDRNETYFKFLKSNAWVYGYFGNLKKSKFTLKTDKDIKDSYFISLLENIAYRAQKSFMKKKMTNEIAKRGLIHFNRDDSTEGILEGFEKRRSEHF